MNSFESIISNNLPVAGTNVLAVEIHQATPGSSDLSFDMRFISVMANTNRWWQDEGGAEIRPHSARLTGTLVSTGAAPAAVRVYWSESDGVTGKLDWSDSEYVGYRPQGPLSVLVTGLLSETSYYYRFYASNDYGEAWATGTARFTTLPEYPLIENGEVSGITQTSAVLNATLVSTGAAPTEVRIFWGMADGGTVRSAWTRTNDLGTAGEGVVGGGISGLTRGTEYYYRFYATNAFGESWAPSTARFDSALSFDDWPFSMQIRFSGYEAPEVLAGFPALVVLNKDIAGFRYEQFASVDGNDLRFSTRDVVRELRYEVEEWNTNGDSLVWVRVPELAAGGFIRAFWGNT